MEQHCHRLNSMSLSYFGKGALTARFANCNEENLGDVFTDPIEVIEKARLKVKLTFLEQHLIPDGCIEHCPCVGAYRQDGWKRVSE